jgi:hypothetical protein
MLSIGCGAVATLEELKAGASIRGLAADGLATVVQVEWFGDQAVNVTFRDATGAVKQRLVYRADEPAPGSRGGRPAVVVRRRRRAVAAGVGGLPDQACPSLRPLSRNPHLADRAAAAPDYRRLWRDAAAAAAALPAGG